MRTILYLLLLLSFLGCKKDDSTDNQLTGTWLFKEGKYGTGGSVNIVKADPIHPIKLLLKRDGSFSIDAAPRLFSLQTRLQFCNRYEVRPNNEIRFYSTTLAEEFVYYFELDESLSFYNPGCREGCSDFFVRGY